MAVSGVQREGDHARSILPLTACVCASSPTDEDVDDKLPPKKKHKASSKAAKAKATHTSGASRAVWARTFDVVVRAEASATSQTTVTTVQQNASVTMLTRAPSLTRRARRAARRQPGACCRAALVLSASLQDQEGVGRVGVALRGGRQRAPQRAQAESLMNRFLQCKF